MRAGKLRQLVTIEQRVDQVDRSGQPVIEWRVFAANVWAAIEFKGGGESPRADAVEATADFEIRIRYLPGVVSGMRVVRDGAVYGIKSVGDPTGRRRELVLACEVVS